RRLLPCAPERAPGDHQRRARHRPPGTRTHPRSGPRFAGERAVSHAHHLDTSTLLARDNVELPRESGRFLTAALMALGALGVVVTAVSAFTGNAFAAKSAFYAYHVGYVFACGLALGALGFVMALYLTNGGWGITIRRQFE